MRRIRMVIPFLPVFTLGLTLLGPATGAEAATQYALRVTGIARDGAGVTVAATVVNTTNNQTYLMNGVSPSGGHTAHVPAGRYEIAAAVPTFHGGSQISATLVARVVHVTHSMTVRLDARPGRRLTVTLSGLPGATQLSQQARVCLNDGQSDQSVAAGGSPGWVFLAPARSREFRFSYASTWQDGPGALADLAGRHAGIPGHPAYHFAASRLARVTVSARIGTSPFGAASWSLQPAGCSAVSEQSIAELQDLSLPDSFVDFRSAGRWMTDLSDNASDWYLTRTYRPGRAYRDQFDRAVRGPVFGGGSDVPEIEGDHFSYFPDNYFNDPALTGSECCGRAAITLRLGPRVVRRATLSQWRKVRDFMVTLHRAGLYSLSVSARRWSPVTTFPPAILSPRVSVNWRFHLTPGLHPGQFQSMPVSLASFLPEGLDANNTAAAGSTTRVAFRIARAPKQDLATPKFSWRTVRVAASFDSGATWRPLRIHRTGSTGVAIVRNPAASRYVSLRITVVDSHGNSTVETIYHAYGVG